MTRAPWAAALAGALVTLAACADPAPPAPATPAPAAAADAPPASPDTIATADAPAVPAPTAPPVEPPPAPAATAPTPATPRPAAPLTVAVSVTNRGFEPARLSLPVGVPSRLAFTRTAETTCATSVRSPDLGLAETPLPLGETVVVEVTPTAGGTYTFACSMDMVSGVVVAE